MNLTRKAPWQNYKQKHVRLMIKWFLNLTPIYDIEPLKISNTKRFLLYAWKMDTTTIQYLVNAILLMKDYEAKFEANNFLKVVVIGTFV
jgi:hypothetical protein